MKIDVRVTEVLSRVITVDEAIQSVEEMYKQEDIILDYTDFKDDVIIEEKED